MRQLLFNHKDAWGVTLGITLVCLISHQDQPEAISFSSALLAAAITVAYWLGFAVNDYCDADYDRLDPEKAARNFFVAVRPRRRTLLFFISLILLAIVFILYPYGWRGAFAFFLSAFIVWAYSAQPLRLKKRPGIDLIVHAVFVQTYPYFLCLFLLQLEINALDTVLLPLFLLSSLAAQLEQQARDYELDRKTEGNFTTRFGQVNTVRMLRLCTAAIIAVFVGGLISGAIPIYLVPLGMIVLPVLLHRYTRAANRPRSEGLVTVTTILGLLYTGGIVLWTILL